MISAQLYPPHNIHIHKFETLFVLCVLCVIVRWSIDLIWVTQYERLGHKCFHSQYKTQKDVVGVKDVQKVYLQT